MSPVLFSLCVLRIPQKLIHVTLFLECFQISASLKKKFNAEYSACFVLCVSGCFSILNVDKSNCPLTHVYPQTQRSQQLESRERDSQVTKESV